jgi:hypothetical protein
MAAMDDGFEALLEPFYNGKKLTDPISTKEDKFQLLPAFLKVKGKLRRGEESLALATEVLTFRQAWSNSISTPSISSLIKR